MEITLNSDNTILTINYAGKTKKLTTKINLRGRGKHVFDIRDCQTAYLAWFSALSYSLSEREIKVAWLKTLGYSVGAITPIFRISENMLSGYYVNSLGVAKEDEAAYVKFLRCCVKFCKTNYNYYLQLGL